MKATQASGVVLSWLVLYAFGGPGIGSCAQLSHGPLVAAVTDNSAKVWVRTDQETRLDGGVQIKYMPDNSLEWLMTPPFPTSLLNDLTLAIPLTNVLPETLYRYTVLVDGVEHPFNTPLPKFKTFPAPTVAAPFKFGVLTDLDPNNIAPAMEALAADAPDLVLILGDYPHATNPGTHPDVLAAARTMHQNTRSQATPAGPSLLQQILYKFPVAHVWDDHDYCCNNSDKTYGGRPAEKPKALQAYDEYWPTYDEPDRPNASQGIWHKFRYGSLVEVYALDLRAQRDPNAEPDNGNKSMLAGDTIPNDQKAWLKESLLASPATWKFLLSSVPWNPTVQKDDAWGGHGTYDFPGFRREQQELLQFLWDHNITGVIVLSGDIHIGGAIDDGTHAKCPEMNVPRTNLGGSGHTCQVSCGQWSEGAPTVGDGYGIVSGSASQVTFKAKDPQGVNRFILTLPAGSACTP